MRRRIYCLLAILWAVANSYAQSPPVTIRPLTIGDTIPADLEITNVYNYPVSKIRLSDLKGKLVILDFWATWCGACIKEFPKMEELQKQFKDRVQLIMVNTDSSETKLKVSDFLKKRKERTGQTLTLTYALQNAAISEYFPHKEVPHYVWLNETGKVVGITTAEEVTQEKVSSMLHDKNTTIFTKKDNLRFNRDKPLLIDENGGDNPTDFIYRSIITGYKDYLGAYIGHDGSSQKGIERYFVLNSSILALLRIAYPDVFKDLGSERTIVESKVFPNNVLLDLPRNRLPENRYCYEIITPPVQSNELKRYMQQDLYRTFKITARNEVRLMDCLMLQPTKEIYKIKTKGGPEQSDFEPTTLKKHIRNQTLESLRTFLQVVLEKPIVTEITLTSKIDLNIPFDIYSYDLKKIQAFLKENGILLIPSKKEMEVVVITDHIK